MILKATHQGAAPNVVKKAVVEAVLVARARLAEVRQLIELVRPEQAIRRYAVRRRVGGTKIIADRALDPDVDFQTTRYAALPLVRQYTSSP